MRRWPLVALCLLSAPRLQAKTAPPETIAPFLGLWLGEQICSESESKVGVFFKESSGGFDVVFYGRPAAAEKNTERVQGKSALRPQEGEPSFKGELKFEVNNPFKDVFGRLGIKRVGVTARLVKKELRELEFSVKADSYKAAGFEIQGWGELAYDGQSLDYFILARTPINTQRCEGYVTRSALPGDGKKR